MTATLKLEPALQEHSSRTAGKSRFNYGFCLDGQSASHDSVGDNDTSSTPLPISSIDQSPISPPPAPANTPASPLTADPLVNCLTMPSSLPYSGKRGLCWPTGTKDALFPFTRPGSKVSWLYNWSPIPHLPGCGSSSIEWVPMQWNGAGIERLADHCAAPKLPPGASALPTALPMSLAPAAPGIAAPALPPRPVPATSGPKPATTIPAARSLLAFNEPERSDQASMPVALAVDLWMQYIEPMRRSGQIQAGSPGIASTEEGILWMQDFIRQLRARGGDVDFWCLHWYGPADLGAFYDYIWSAHARIGGEKRVWITEYACTNWDTTQPIDKDKVEWFLRETIKYLDTLGWVERYAWFGPMRDTGNVGRWAALLDENGSISDLGKIYRDT